MKFTYDKKYSRQFFLWMLGIVILAIFLMGFQAYLKKESTDELIATAIVLFFVFVFVAVISLFLWYFMIYKKMKRYYITDEEKIIFYNGKKNIELLWQEIQAIDWIPRSQYTMEGVNLKTDGQSMEVTADFMNFKEMLKIIMEKTKDNVDPETLSPEINIYLNSDKYNPLLRNKSYIIALIIGVIAAIARIILVFRR